MEDNVKSMDQKITETIEALRANRFEVWYANDKTEARKIFWEEIFNKIKPGIVSWGDSLTLHSLEIIPQLRQLEDIEFIETFGEHLTRVQIIANRKRALATSDIFITGTNAVTMKGQLVNLDMIGNRIAGIAFGPRRVVIFVGVNKIVENIDQAVDRIKNIAAPLNAKRHTHFKTPCQETGRCMDCSSPTRICNTWMITEKSYPPGKIKIILINEELGY